MMCMPLPVTEIERWQKDHDLLIELKTQLGFQGDELENSGRILTKLDDKMGRFLEMLDKKADKAEVVEIRHELNKKVDRSEHTDLLIRVGKIDELHIVDKAKKEVVINLGNMGYKGWLLLTGVVLFIISVANFVNK